MLRKIKKYKITIRPSYASRLAKKKFAEAAPDDETLERETEQEIRRCEPLIVPTALYDTFSRKETPEPLRKLWEQAPSAKTLSLSLIAASLDPRIEQEIDALREKAEAHQSVLAEAVARESLDQSVNFVHRLIGEEAKDDNCELSPLWPVEPALVRDFLGALESHKAGIMLKDDDRFTPLYSRVSFCFWVPLSKR